VFVRGRELSEGMARIFQIAISPDKTIRVKLRGILQFSIGDGRDILTRGEIAIKKLPQYPTVDARKAIGGNKYANVFSGDQRS